MNPDHIAQMLKDLMAKRDAPPEPPPAAPPVPRGPMMKVADHEAEKAKWEALYARLESDNAGYIREVYYLEEELKGFKERLEMAREDAYTLSHERLQDSERSLANVMVLGLHLAERNMLAYNLGKLARDTIYQVRAILSDAPEPLTLNMLDELEKAVEDLNQPPSDRVKELLAEITGQDIEAEPEPVKKRPLRRKKT